jgi:hypothetical protein
MQLILGNYTNLWLHVSHATKFWLQTTIVKQKNSSSDNGNMQHIPMLSDYQNFHYQLALHIKT